MADLEAVLSSLAESLGPVSAAPVPLLGGITNRNFRVRFASADCVVRLPGRQIELLGISREAECLAAQRAAELGVAPEVLATGAGHLITRYVDCEPHDPAALRADPAPIARALRAFHDCGLRLPVGFWVPDLLDVYAETVRRRGQRLPAAYGTARELVARIAAVLPLREPVSCHNDLLPGNLLQDADGAVLLVDWEYAAMGHRLFDLGNLAVNNEFDEAADERLLSAYDGVAPSRGRRAALTLMRIVSDAREAAWGVVQQTISDLDFDFAGYAARHFERLRRAAEDPRLPGWLEVADGSPA